eukprot:CAMPEP_0197841838 /NCGR_PEP_ID=MMETSP1437-20131217/46403_1 /TAXON_ID=49252 ORGANISM="Eucampia antarctica, Strain CCMP1452" /NCGR_SAMPLE_ID=MMETSP1437 /ASSEMBLY_ACC=CAM_ASM_001096 /LENGTH=368 /DNA_ID=CAMNT_0043451645 /DNA_START=187 /DNA_END=1294 /DNA_ORIENTATION=+
MNNSQNFGKKRIKGKVGKRAPQRLNATDTAFRTATVEVRPQSTIVSQTNKHNNNNNDDNHDSLELISSRGKTLDQLIPSLGHHASNVRQSALQGIRDAIQKKLKSIPKTTNINNNNNNNNSITANLSVLMPSLSRCLVDEDKVVRSTAIAILRDMVPHLASSSSSSSNNSNSSSSNNVMIPFLPLTMAYMTSALNSLDSDLRYDGCLAIDLFYTHYGSTILLQTKNNNNDNNDNVHPRMILPAFVRVLADASTHRSRHSNNKNNNNNNKKNKKTKNDTNNDNNSNSSSSSNRSMGVFNRMHNLSTKGFQSWNIWNGGSSIMTIAIQTASNTSVTATATTSPFDGCSPFSSSSSFLEDEDDDIVCIHSS